VVDPPVEFVLAFVNLHQPEDDLPVANSASLRLLPLVEGDDPLVKLGSILLTQAPMGLLGLNLPAGLRDLGRAVGHQRFPLSVDHDPAVGRHQYNSERDLAVVAALSRVNRTLAKFLPRQVSALSLGADLHRVLLGHAGSSIVPMRAVVVLDPDFLLDTPVNHLQ